MLGSRRPAAIAALIALATLISVLSGRGATPAHAQLPMPGTVVSVFVQESTDGMGMVVTWSVAPVALYNDGFILFRRLSTTSDMQAIAQLGNAARGYTDYGIPSAGFWCYQAASQKGGQIIYLSMSICASFVPGVHGVKQPVFNAGCSLFFDTATAGTPMSQVAARFDPASAVYSIWRYDAGQGRYTSGYYADPTAPTDFTALPTGSELEYVCLYYIATFRS